jgi:hypothetical protein
MLDISVEHGHGDQPAHPFADSKRYQEILKATLWRDNVLRLKAQAQVGVCLCLSS